MMNLLRLARWCLVIVLSIAACGSRAARADDSAAQPVAEVVQYVIGTMKALDVSRQIAIEQGAADDQQRQITEAFATLSKEMENIAAQHTAGSLATDAALAGVREKKLAWFVKLKSILGPERFNQMQQKYAAMYGPQKMPETTGDQRLKALAMAIRQLKLDAAVQTRAIDVVADISGQYLNLERQLAMGMITRDDFQTQLTPVMDSLEAGMKRILPPDAYTRVWELAGNELARRKGNATKPS